MPRLQLKDFGGARPKLMPEDLEESPSLLTIAAVELVEVPDSTAPTGLRKSVILTFKEFPDRVLWLNRGQIETLMHRLSDNTDSWIGEIVPVEPYVAEF